MIESCARIFVNSRMAAFRLGLAKRSLSKLVESAAHAAGFREFLPVQNLVLTNSDKHANLLVKSPTGSGKTLAFLLPAVDHVLQNPEKRTSQVLIIAPSRDLGSQIMKELRKLFEHCQSSFDGDWMSFCAFLSGGKSTKSNLFFLQKSPRIVIGSPGVLLEMVGSEMLEPRDFELVVLDEVDQLLAKGFAEETENILSLISPERFLGFSATNSIEVDERLRAVIPRHEFTFLKTHEKEIHEKDFLTDLSPTIIHYKKKLSNEVNPSSIAEEIRKLREKFSSSTGSTIVFCNKKREVDALAGSLRMVDDAPWSGVFQIHGDFPQNQRNKIMKAVRGTEKCLLIGKLISFYNSVVQGFI